jgi:hypothetical protein
MVANLCKRRTEGRSWEGITEEMYATKTSGAKRQSESLILEIDQQAQSFIIHSPVVSKKFLAKNAKKTKKEAAGSITSA